MECPYPLKLNKQEALGKPKNGQLPSIAPLSVSHPQVLSYECPWTSSEEILNHFVHTCVNWKSGARSRYCLRSSALPYYSSMML